MNLSLLFEKEAQVIAHHQQHSFLRRNIEAVDFPIVGYVGLRGVGKTTLLLQMRLQTEKSIYITLDDLALQGIELYQIIQELHK